MSKTGCRPLSFSLSLSLPRLLQGGTLGSTHHAGRRAARLDVIPIVMR